MCARMNPTCQHHHSGINLTMTQKSTIATQITTLTEIIQAQALDESTRLEALNAARGLLATLESPTERIIQDVVMNPPILMALRMGVQLGVFTQVSEKPEQGVTSTKVSEDTGASFILVDQIARLLATTGYLKQSGVQTFKPSTLTLAMADPSMEATTRVW
ncbi:O-methyltransferase family 2 [Penicillium frequentans]|nr:O-methyltransferase family 2 [Penicillium glabrum]